MMKELSEPECFALLGNRQRLLLLQILKESSVTPLSTRELAERIAERAYENPSAEDLRDIHISLYHNHLPRFEKADVVSFNWDDDTVEVRPNFDTIITFLD